MVSRSQGMYNVMYMEVKTQVSYNAVLDSVAGAPLIPGISFVTIMFPILSFSHSVVPDGGGELERGRRDREVCQ